jgi:hypothetical protein
MQPDGDEAVFANARTEKFQAFSAPPEKPPLSASRKDSCW